MQMESNEELDYLKKSQNKTKLEVKKTQEKKNLKGKPHQQIESGRRENIQS